MKFTIDVKTFQTHLLAVLKVIDLRNQFYIQGFFLFRLKKGVLTITGSDSDNIISSRVNVIDYEGEGEIMVPHEILLDILNKIDTQLVTFDVDVISNKIEVLFRNGYFSFMGSDAKEYTNREDLEAALELNLPSSVVRKGIDNTLFAVGHNPLLPMMNGIFWDIHMNDVTFVASDSYKLVRYINAEASPGKVISFIMPAKSAAVIRAIIDKNTDDIRILIGRDAARLEVEGFSVLFHFVKENFPNFNRVIPYDYTSRLKVNRTTLANALSRVAVIGNNTFPVKIEITINEIKLSVEHHHYNAKAEENVFCKYNGGPLTIGFHASFLQEILLHIDSEDIIIDLSDPKRPAVFQPSEQKENENLVAMLMPIQLIE